MSDHKPTDPAKLRRQERLEATLRDNLRRRKAQAKARSEGGRDETEEDGTGDGD